METDLINQIVCEAVLHGADAGGSYDSNEKGLTQALQRYIDFKGISNDYTVENVKFGCQKIPQLVCTKCTLKEIQNEIL